jgi:hypothetical protein
MWWYVEQLAVSVDAIRATTETPTVVKVVPSAKFLAFLPFPPQQASESLWELTVLRAQQDVGLLVIAVVMDPVVQAGRVPLLDIRVGVVLTRPLPIGLAVAVVAALQQFSE